MKIKEEVFTDVFKRAYRLVDESKHSLTIEQLFKMVARQIPQVSGKVVLYVITSMIDNDEFPAGKKVLQVGVIPQQEEEPQEEGYTFSASSGPVQEDQYFSKTSNLTLSEAVVTTDSLELINYKVPKMEVDEEMAEEFIASIDAEFKKYIDELWLSEDFKTLADSLPSRIDALFDEHGELTGAEAVDLLEIDTSKLGIRYAFVVAWRQVKAKLYAASDLAQE